MANFRLSFFSWTIVCLTLFDGVYSQSELVQLISQTAGANDSVRGMLEARTSTDQPWRKVCSASRSLALSHPVPVAACNDLGYKRVKSLTVGGTKLAGDKWISFSRCPAVAADPDADNPSTLRDCTPTITDGITASCNKNRFWIWLTCMEKVEPPRDPSIIWCRSGKDVVQQELEVGASYTVEFNNKSDCTAQLNTSDPESYILMRPANGSSDITDRLSFRVRYANGTSSSNRKFTSPTANKAARSSNGAHIEISYIKPLDSSSEEDVRITVSARRPLICSVNQMDILLLKSEIKFSTPSGPSTDKISASINRPDNSRSCGHIPADPESDVIGTTLDMGDCGIPVAEKDYFESAITFSDVLPSNDPTAPPSVIEYLQKTKYAFRCTRSDWNVTSQVVKVV